MSSNEKRPESGNSRYDKVSSIKDIDSTIRSELSVLEKYFNNVITDDNDDNLINSINEWLSNDAFYHEFVLGAPQQNAMDDPEAGGEVLRRDWAKILIRELLGGQAQPFLKPGLKLLSEAISATLKAPTLAVWKKSEEAKALSEDEIRSRVTDLSTRLRARTKLEMRDVMPQWLRPTSGNPSPSQMLEEHQMARQSNERERDENGRFVSDDDRGNSRQASSNSRDDRRRSDDEEDRRGWYGDRAGHAEAARRGWEDRERSSTYGRASDEDRGYARQDRDDDRRYSRGSDDDRRSHGGWFGDSRGHSQAARQGWDERDNGRRDDSPSHYREDDRSSYRQRDDEGRFTSGSSRSHYNEDDRRSSGRSRDEEGRFSSGYSDERGTRSRYDDDNRGSHSRGRDDEGRFTSDSRYSNDDRRSSPRDNDDNRYSSRSRDEEDDGRSGNPGWSGDPRGHAEAARKGWENRRR